MLIEHDFFLQNSSPHLTRKHTPLHTLWSRQSGRRSRRCRQSTRHRRQSSIGWSERGRLLLNNDLNHHLRHKHKRHVRHRRSKQSRGRRTTRLRQGLGRTGRRGLLRPRRRHRQDKLDRHQERRIRRGRRTGTRIRLGFSSMRIRVVQLRWLRWATTLHLRLRHKHRPPPVHPPTPFLSPPLRFRSLFLTPR